MAKATFEVVFSREHTDEEYDFLPLHIILKEDLKCFVFWCSGPNVSTARQCHPHHQPSELLWTSS